MEEVVNAVGFECYMGKALASSALPKESSKALGVDTHTHTHKLGAYLLPGEHSLARPSAVSIK